MAIVIGVRIYRFMLDWRSLNERKKKRVETLIRIISLICVAIVGGIIVAKWIGNFALELACTCEGGMCAGYLAFMIVTTLLGATFTYAVGYPILGLYHFKEIWFKVLTVVVFVVSIVAWAIPIWQYNQNIEIKEETTTKIEERTLIYFSGIPVQQISGTVSGDSFLGFGDVEGEISTSNEIPYWYLNEEGRGIQDFVTSSKTEIDFIEDGEKAYLEIITYTTHKTRINHNNGKESYVCDDEIYIEYVAHLPKYVTQFNIE